MLSNSSEAPAAASPLRPSEAKRTDRPAPDPRAIIEVASGGSGSSNDTSGTYKPPGVHDPGDLAGGL